MKEPDNRAVSADLQHAALQTQWEYIFCSIALIVLAVSPAILCACLARTSAGWHLFERSGSIVTIAGLLLASRRYFEHTVTDLVGVHNNGAGFESSKALGDILATRRGLTLSAFGTLIWGWGTFLRWWSFGVLALWMAFMIYRAFRDPVLQRRRADAMAIG